MAIYLIIDCYPESKKEVFHLPLIHPTAKTFSCIAYSIAYMSSYVAKRTENEQENTETVEVYKKDKRLDLS